MNLVGARTTFANHAVCLCPSFARYATGGHLRGSRSCRWRCAGWQELSQPADHWTEDDEQADSASLAATASAPTPGKPVDSLTQRTANFSQRLTNWLRQQSWLPKSGADGEPLKIELSLDALDRPHATLSGPPDNPLNEALNEQLSNALASDPSWLDEFRHLALDRGEQQGPTHSNVNNQHLTIEIPSATIEAEHRWK